LEFLSLTSGRPTPSLKKQSDNRLPSAARLFEGLGPYETALFRPTCGAGLGLIREGAGFLPRDARNWRWRHRGDGGGRGRRRPDDAGAPGTITRRRNGRRRGKRIVAAIAVDIAVVDVAIAVFAAASVVVA